MPKLAFATLLIIPAVAADAGSGPADSEATGRAVPQAGKNESATDWTRFRGPDGMGISDARDVPVTWGESDNIAWKKVLPGGGSSSPVIFGESIYLTTYSGYLVPGEDAGSPEQLQRHLVCLSKSTGEEEWIRTVPAKLPEEDRIRDHGFAANTPVVDESGVIVFLGKSGVHAFDHNGEKQWSADVGDGTHNWGTSASPVIYEDIVFVNASVESQSLFAFDRQTGDLLWRAGGIKQAWNSPLIVETPDGEDELIIAVKGSVFGLNPQSGERLWTCDTDITWYMVPTVVAADGVVYALGGRSGNAALAVRTGGRGDVTETHRLWTSKKGSNVTSPVLHEGHLYWMHEKIGIAYCADVETGELVYEERVSGAGQVYASAFLADGRIYYTNRSGRTYVVPAAPEFRLLATNELGDGTLFNASAAVADRRILIRSEKHLYCIGE